jgi:hypothetical protein
MKDLKIIDPETGTTPISDDAQRIIGIQLMVAGIVADDARKIMKISPHLSEKKIIEYLLGNWTESIRDFASEMIAKQVDVDDISS